MIVTEEVTAAQCKYIITAPGLWELDGALGALETTRPDDEPLDVYLDFTVRVEDGTDRVITVKCAEISLPPEPVSMEMEASLRGFVGDDEVDCSFKIGGSGHIEVVSGPPTDAAP